MDTNGTVYCMNAEDHAFDAICTSNTCSNLEYGDGDDELYLTYGCLQLPKQTVLMLDAREKKKTESSSQSLWKIGELRDALLRHEVVYTFQSCRLTGSMDQCSIILLNDLTPNNPSDFCTTDVLNLEFRKDQEKMIAICIDGYDCDGKNLNRMAKLDGDNEHHQTRNVGFRTGPTPADIETATKYLYEISLIKRPEKFDIDQESLTMATIVDEFVEQRQQRNDISHVDFQRWIALCRLKALSEGRTTCCLGDWRSVVALDGRRRQKLARSLNSVKRT